MGCVGYKLLLAVVAALDAVKHGVNDGGQILQLVLCPLDVDAVGQVAGGQSGSHIGNVADGCQHALVQAVSLADKVQHAQKVAQRHRQHQPAPGVHRPAHVIGEQQHLPALVQRQAQGRRGGNQLAGEGCRKDQARLILPGVGVERILEGCGKGRVLQDHLAVYAILIRLCTQRPKAYPLDMQSFHAQKHRGDDQRRQQRSRQQLPAVVHGDAEGQRQAEAAHDAAEGTVQHKAEVVEAADFSGLPFGLGGFSLLTHS